MFNVAVFVGAAALGVFFQRIMDELIKPDIRIEIGHQAFIPAIGTPQHKFIHVLIKNHKRNFLMRLLLRNTTPNNTRVWISFLDYVSKAEILKINGRWTSKREPFNYQTNQVDLGEALIVPREVLPAGEEIPVSVGVKEGGKDNCFAFNNESYLHNKWQKPDYELTDKRYILNIKVSSEGQEWSKEFLLLNSGKTLGRFSISEIPD